MGLFNYSNKTDRTAQVTSVARRARVQLSADMLRRMGCRACPLDRQESRLDNPKMRPTGTKNPRLYIMGEAPGADEDRGDEQFIGTSGRLMRETVRRAFNLNGRNDDENRFVRWNNAIRCHPKDNRDPEESELTCCMPKQFDDIGDVRPKVILAVGKIALTSLTGLPHGKTRIKDWRGRQIAFEVDGHPCWIVPTHHPAFILRAENSESNSKGDRADRDLRQFFIRDVTLAAKLSELEPPPSTVWNSKTAYEGVTELRNFGEIMKFLKRFEGDKWAGTDLETTGLRPYMENAKILTASLSHDGKSTAFPIEHPEARFTKSEQEQIFEEYRRALIRSQAIWAHNLNFELEWLVWKYGPEIAYKMNGQDSMAQAYILDERGGALALEHLTLIHFGVLLKELSDGLDKSDMINEPLEKVLPYNALDSKACSHVAPIQSELLRIDGLDAIYDEHRRRSRPISIMQNLGMVPDAREIEKLDEKFRAIEETSIAEVMGNAEVHDYVTNKEPDFNLNAPACVSRLLVHLGFPEAAGGSDEAVLKEIKHPVVPGILTMREYKKLRGTYLAPFKPEKRDERGKLMRARGASIQPDGLVHTQFLHNLTTTGRLSSREPNMQNVPIRKHPEMRGIYTARISDTLRDKFLIMLGNDVWVCSCDQGQIEARVIGMASKDKFLCQSIWAGYDIHMEWSERIAHRVPRLVGGTAGIKDKATMKEFRSKVKNKWTFPLFYKSSLGSVCNSFDCDEGELGPLYEDFWDQFPGVLEWQEKTIEFYHENGYVPTLTGRRRWGPMTPNMIVNSPIQGTASDIVIDSMERLSQYAVENDRMDLHPRLNVHDDLTTLLRNEGLDESIDTICRHMLTCDFWFINVPLTVEVKLGRTWGETKEIAVVSSEDYK